MNELIEALRICRAGNCKDCHRNGTMDCDINLYSDAADAIERLTAQVPEWISVEDRLPEKSGQYLTYNEYGWFNAYPYSIIHKQWNTQDWMSEKSAKGVAINSITHWMPLPKAPEG